jgi:hypothetical protein
VDIPRLVERLAKRVSRGEGGGLLMLYDARMDVVYFALKAGDKTVPLKLKTKAKPVRKRSMQSGSRRQRTF